MQSFPIETLELSCLEQAPSVAITLRHEVQYQTFVDGVGAAVERWHRGFRRTWVIVDQLDFIAVWDENERRFRWWRAIRLLLHLRGGHCVGSGVGEIEDVVLFFRVMKTEKLQVQSSGKSVHFADER